MITSTQLPQHEAFFNFCHSKNAYGYLDILEMLLNAKIPYQIVSDYVNIDSAQEIMKSIAFYIYGIEIDENNYSFLEEIQRILISDHKESVENGFMSKDDDYINQIKKMF